MTSTHDAVARYYAGRLAEFGPTPRGVDWNGPESQELRFDMLSRLFVHEPRDAQFSVLDYGCGYGAFYEWLTRTGRCVQYVGYDIAPEMIAAARQQHEKCKFTHDAAALAPADYVVASGIFNVKLAYDVVAWEGAMRDTLAQMARLARRGFAFNVLTKYSDAEKMRPNLYYADPAYWFDHCKRNLGRYVALLHDYPIYEFTLIVRKEENASWPGS